MIVNINDKSFQTRSDMPSSNWLGKGWVVVPDNSDLAKKIETFYPRFDLVLDEKGELIDVAEIPKTEEELNKERIDEIDKELVALDNEGLTRVIEDIIEHTGIFSLMFSTTKKVIENKKALREERQKLIKEIGGM